MDDEQSRRIAADQAKRAIQRLENDNKADLSQAAQQTTEGKGSHVVKPALKRAIRGLGGDPEDSKKKFEEQQLKASKTMRESFQKGRQEANAEIDEIVRKVSEKNKGQDTEPSKAITDEEIASNN